jgi:hypothetical protein
MLPLMGGSATDNEGEFYDLPSKDPTVQVNHMVPATPQLC